MIEAKEQLKEKTERKKQTKVVDKVTWVKYDDDTFWTKEIKK